MGGAKGKEGGDIKTADTDHLNIIDFGGEAEAAVTFIKKVRFRLDPGFFQDGTNGLQDTPFGRASTRVSSARSSIDDAILGIDMMMPFHPQEAFIRRYGQDGTPCATLPPNQRHIPL